MNQIEINISSFSESTNFQITEINDSYTIIMKVLDEIIDSESFENEQHELFEKIYQKIQNNERHQLGKLAEQLNQLSEKHLRYKTLSLEFSKDDNSNYHLLFQSINKYESESSKEQENERTKAILDGYSVILKTKSDFCRIHAPDNNSHPILTNFIRSTTNLLKEEYPIDFQNKKIINL